jgi:hypothetical protein
MHGYTFQLKRPACNWMEGFIVQLVELACKVGGNAVGQSVFVTEPLWIELVLRLKIMGSA